MRDLTITAIIKVYQYDELNEADRALVTTAKEATARSYVPYSHFSVGAAALLGDDSGRQTGDQIGTVLDDSGPDAGIARNTFIGTDRTDMASEARPVQQNRQQNRQDQHHPDRERNRADQGTAERAERFVLRRYKSRIGKIQRQGTENNHRSKRGDERRNFPDRHQQSVRRSADSSRHDCNQSGKRHRRSLRTGKRIHSHDRQSAGKSQQRTDRKVDSRSGDHKGHTERDNAAVRHLPRYIDQILNIAEMLVGKTAYDQQNDQSGIRSPRASQQTCRRL